MFQYLKLLLFALLLVSTGCDQTPVNPGRAGIIDLKLNFIGRPVSSANLAKAAHLFTHLTLEVFATESAVNTPNDLAPLAAVTIELDSNATSFEGRLTLPAGENRFLVAKLYEKSGATSALAESSVVSYCGKKNNLSIQAGQVNEITLDLFPAPIRHRRVVFWVESVQAELARNTAEIPVKIATLDSLRGLQFDLVFDPPDVTTDSVSRKEAAGLFSTVQFNDIPNRGVRILLFDQTTNSRWILPLSSPCFAPVLLFGVQVRLPEAYEIIQVTMEEIIVSTQNLKNLEIYVVPAQILRKSN